MSVKEMTDLLEAEGRLFSRIRELLEKMQEAARKKAADDVVLLTGKLSTEYEAAAGIDKRIIALAAEEAGKLGVPMSKFKLSMMPGGGGFPDRIDRLRDQLRDVAVIAARTGGVLSANISVIEDTVKVLESLDARAAGYGVEKAPKRPAKIIDRTA